MNKKQIYAYGYSNGYSALECNQSEAPSFGEKLPRHIDWQGIGIIETADDFRECMEMIASEGESNSRQYSPFEFFAHDVNESHDPDALWEAYDNGVTAGIRAAIRKIYPIKELRSLEKEFANK